MYLSNPQGDSHSCSFFYQFVAVTQPLNTLAFVFDGVNFGASDFAYSALSMVGFSSML